MDEETPDQDENSTAPSNSSGMSLAVFQALNEGLEGARRMCFLSEVVRTQALLALWDGMLLDETERGLTVSPNGKAERAFIGHLAGLLHLSKPRTITLLHASIAARDLEVSYAMFRTGAFAWQAMESVVRNLGSLRGDARQQYDLRAARLAAEENPQQLDAALSRLHDELDHEDATETAAAAHRQRRVRGRPGALGAATLTLTGPQTDIAAMYETAHRLAVAAHGSPGETRTMDQLRYDCTVDVVLAGFAAPPATGAAPGPTPHVPAAAVSGAAAGVGPDGALDGDDPRRPSTPFERLGDPRVPDRTTATSTSSAPRTASSSGAPPAGAGGSPRSPPSGSGDGRSHPCGPTTTRPPGTSPPEDDSDPGTSARARVARGPCPRARIRGSSA